MAGYRHWYWRRGPPAPANAQAGGPCAPGRRPLRRRCRHNHRLAERATTWSKRVDCRCRDRRRSHLEPGTRPPPGGHLGQAATRRAGGVSWPAIDEIDGDRDVMPFGAARSTTSSTVLFHSSQASHFPAHLADTAPQAWQIYWLVRLAIAGVAQCRAMDMAIGPSARPWMNWST